MAYNETKASAGNVVEPATPDNSQIARELRELGEVAGYLWNTISTLEDALRPVLSLSDVDKDSGDTAAVPQLVPVAEVIRDHRVFVSNAVSRLDSIYRRLGV